MVKGAAPALVVVVVAGVVVVGEVTEDVGGVAMVAGGPIDDVGSGGGGEKMTPGSGRVVAVVVVIGGTTAEVVAVDRPAPAAVVLVAEGFDDVVVDELASVVVGRVVVGRANTVVTVTPGRAKVDSPLGPERLASRAVAATTRPRATTATTENTTMLLRVVAVCPRHHERSRSGAPARPKPVFFPMDRRNASRPVAAPPGGRAALGPARVENGGVSRRHGKSSEVTKAVLAFMAAGLVVVVLISVAAAFLAVRAARGEAVREAKDLSEVDGEAVVGPALEAGLFTEDAGAVSRLDAIVRSRVLGDRIVRVKVWSSAGQILYSDEARLVGAHYPLGEDERRTLAAGGTNAEVSDLVKPENRFERPWGKLLEVYRRLDAPGGQPVLFETYLPYDQVDSLVRDLTVSLAPALIGGLVLLYLIQIPLAWRMARRLDEGQRQRLRLARRAADASETERRRIAADLHDGVVQGLVGSSYTLTAAAERARAAGQAGLADTVSQAGADLRQWVKDLRTLLVNIAPPRLHQEGLAAALSDLASTASARGVAATAHVDPGLHLDPDMETLVFRAAQEAVRNATGHGHPSVLRLRVRRVAGDRVRLEVEDDGAGFEPSRREEAGAQGHVGLSLLGALAEDAGGRLDVDSAPGRGTRVTMEVPA